jgi:hypothetical protein
VYQFNANNMIAHFPCLFPQFNQEVGCISVLPCRRNRDIKEGIEIVDKYTTRFTHFLDYKHLDDEMIRIIGFIKRIEIKQTKGFSYDFHLVYHSWSVIFISILFDAEQKPTVSAPSLFSGSVITKKLKR